MKPKPIQQQIIVFYDGDLPNMATHCPQEECGFSIYRNILVQWDEDGDDRVLWFIDHLSERVREQLLIVQEHEGELALRWKLGWAPSGYRQGDEVDVGGDLWSIGSSLGTMGTAEEPPE